MSGAACVAQLFRDTYVVLEGLTYPARLLTGGFLKALQAVPKVSQLGET